MLDDLFEDSSLGGEPSKRAQIIGRLFFGLICGGLAAVGAVKFLTDASFTSNQSLRLSVVSMFAALFCLAFFNVILARPWKWPGVLFFMSLAAMFLTRIVGGP